MSELADTRKIVPLLLLIICVTTAGWRLMNPPLYPRVATWVAYGWDELGDGEYGVARDWFHAVLTIDPGNTEAGLGKNMLDVLGYPRMDRPLREARTMIRALIDEMPNEPYQLMIAGEIEYRLGNPDLASDYLDAALAINPTIPWAHYYKGLIHLRNGERPKAIAALKRSVVLNSGRRRVVVDLAHLMWREGDYAGALGYYPEIIATNVREEDLKEYFDEARLLLLVGELNDAQSRFISIRDKYTLASGDPNPEFSRVWQSIDLPGGNLRSAEEKMLYLNAVVTVLDTLLYGTEFSDDTVIAEVAGFPRAARLLANDIEAIADVSRGSSAQVDTIIGKLDAARSAQEGQSTSE